MNEPQPADARAERLRRIREENVTRWEASPRATVDKLEACELKWLLDELEKADMKIAYDEAVLVRVTKAIEKTAAERDALEVKLAQIRDLFRDDVAEYTAAYDVKADILAIIDAPASEGEKQ